MKTLTSIFLSSLFTTAASVQLTTSEAAPFEPVATVGKGWDFTHYFQADWTGDGVPDLLVRDKKGGMSLYPFVNGTFYSTIQVGEGWSFTHYFPGDWTGDGVPDLLVRDKKGRMYVYPFLDGSFYNSGGPIQVGEGWNFTHYFPGDWTGDGVPDLLVRDKKGDMYVYPFVDGSFNNGGDPIQVGGGWNFTHYFPGDWTGDGVPDLLVRDKKGDMYVYPFVDGSFYNGGDPIKVGNGWKFTRYVPGDWDGDSIPDLLVQGKKGNMFIYPFKNNTFINGGGPIDANVVGGCTHFFPHFYTGTGDAMLCRDKSGDMMLYDYVVSVVIGQNYQGGIIFYLDSTGNHGLIAAPTDQGSGIQWSYGAPWDPDSYRFFGATGIAVGTGLPNTAKIIQRQGTPYYAANLCYDLVIGAYSDWYLPSKDELNLMYTTIGPGAAAPLTNVGGFFGDYWSSSEIDKIGAWSLGFGDGYDGYGDQYDEYKSNTNVVRAVRAF